MKFRVNSVEAFCKIDEKLTFDEILVLFRGQKHLKDMAHEEPYSTAFQK